MQIVDSVGVTQQTMVPSVFTVERRRRETADTFTLDLTPAHGTREFGFSPGQFNPEQGVSDLWAIAVSHHQVVA